MRFFQISFYTGKSVVKIPYKIRDSPRKNEQNYGPNSSQRSVISGGTIYGNVI